jgi:hypothetical protein
MRIAQPDQSICKDVVPHRNRLEERIRQLDRRKPRQIRELLQFGNRVQAADVVLPQVLQVQAVLRVHDNSLLSGEEH